MMQRFDKSRPAGPPATPGPEIRRSVPPLPAGLIADYVRHVGGDPSAYRREVPVHLFPQWAFPLAARTLIGIPYPLVRVMNGGCAMRVNGPLPVGEPLETVARLESIDDDGRRAVLQQHVLTGPRSQPDALVADFFAVVPLGGGKSNGEPKPKKKDKPRVPRHVREIAYWRIPKHAGMDFAKLTGDFNPVHWLEPHARAMGFRSVILHGFSTMARAYEGLVRGLYAGDVHAIGAMDVRFTRPLILPAKVGLFVDGNAVFVGDAPGGPAYLTGTFEERD